MAGALKKSVPPQSLKASQLRLDPFTIFLDENHCDNPHILRVLDTAGETYIRLTVYYGRRGVLDEEWLPDAGRNGWIVISADKRLWRHAVQRQLLFDWGIRAFIFTENNLRGEMRGEIVRKALPEMHQIVKETPPPFVASLTVEGHAHIIFDVPTHRRIHRKEMRALRENRTLS